MAFPARTIDELRERQRQGQLRVTTALDFRRRVADLGLARAYAETDVLAAAGADFTDQGLVTISLGPADPPLRLRRALLGDMTLEGGFGAGELCLPIGGGLGGGGRRGGAHVLADLLAGRELPLALQGEVTPLHPRRDLVTSLDLRHLGNARLVLQRGLVEGGVVAVSSAEGVLASPYGPLLGPYGNALFTGSGARSVGHSMPGLLGLGPGQPVLVAGAIGQVLGPGSGHQPGTRRQPGGQARAPGASLALSAPLPDLDPRWLRPAFFEGHGASLLVAVAAPVPLLEERHARQAAASDAELEVPVLDFSIPRRVRPGFGTVTYAELLAGRIQVDGHRLPVGPACSLRLTDEIADELVQRLQDGRFPLGPAAGLPTVQPPPPLEG
jgi:uncharacterized protein (DUF39 family)